MKHFLSNQKVEIDIHSMQRAEAKKYLERFLSQVNGSVREVVVIHGFHSGTVLQRLVRQELKHHRIRSRVVGLNEGVTTLLLGPDDGPKK